MKKIKIGHIVGGLMFGGVETFLINYVEAMDTSNLEIHLYTYTDPIEECAQRFEAAGCIIHQVSSMESSPFVSFKDLIQQLKNDEIDIAHCHMTFTNFHGLGAAFFAGVKIRISHAHLFNIQEGSKVKRFIRNHLYSFLSNLVSTHYLAASEPAALDLFGKKRVKRKEVTLLKNAISQQRFEFSPEDRQYIKKKHNISNKEKVIGNIGRFVNQKNHKFVIDIFNELLKINSEYKLIIIGTGELEKDIKKQIHSLNIDKKVVIVDPLQDIYKYYSSFDLFLFPSLYEGLGIVVIEAQANEVNILASANVIPKEAKLTKAYHELSLELTAKEWAEYINKMSFERVPIFNELIDNGLDINYESEKLLDYYLKIYGGVKGI